MTSLIKMENNNVFYGLFLKRKYERIFFKNISDGIVDFYFMVGLYIVKAVFFDLIFVFLRS